jgi:hypothetical protein
LTESIGRQDIVITGGDEPGRVRPALRERAQVLLAPGVVNDHEDAAIAQSLAQLCRRGVDIFQARALARQSLDEVGDDRHQVLWFFTEFHPENAVEIGVLNVGIVRQRPGKRRLAVAARTAQRSGDGDRIALSIKELLLERVEFSGPLHEVGRQLGRHHGDAFLGARALQDTDQIRVPLWHCQVVDLAKPTRQVVEVFEARSSDRANRLALLAGQPDLAAHHGACQRRRRDDKNEMQQRL